MCNVGLTGDILYYGTPLDSDDALPDQGARVAGVKCLQQPRLYLRLAGLDEQNMPSIRSTFLGSYNYLASNV